MSNIQLMCCVRAREPLYLAPTAALGLSRPTWRTAFQISLVGRAGQDEHLPSMWHFPWLFWVYTEWASTCRTVWLKACSVDPRSTIHSACPGQTMPHATSTPEGVLYTSPILVAPGLYYTQFLLLLLWSLHYTQHLRTPCAAQAPDQLEQAACEVWFPEQALCVVQSNWSGHQCLLHPA